MKFSRTYIITKWTEWHRQLNESINEFYDLYSLFPNILEANSHTFSQIDFVTGNNPAEREKLFRKNPQTGEIIKPGDGENVRVFAFNTINCELDFAEDKKLKDREIRLIYDSSPAWEDKNNPKSPVGEDKFSFIMGKLAENF